MSLQKIAGPGVILSTVYCVVCGSNGPGGIIVRHLLSRSGLCCKILNHGRFMCSNSILFTKNSKMQFTDIVVSTDFGQGYLDYQMIC